MSKTEQDLDSAFDDDAVDGLVEELTAEVLADDAGDLDVVDAPDGHVAADEAPMSDDDAVVDDGAVDDGAVGDGAVDDGAAADHVATDDAGDHDVAADGLDVDDVDDADGEVAEESLTAAAESIDAESSADVAEDVAGQQVDVDDVSVEAVGARVADASGPLPAPVVPPGLARALVFEDDEFSDDEFVDDDQTFDVPKIVMATEDDPADQDEARRDETAIDGADAREGTDVPEVSDDILEELRRADIDGPIVEMAPQDDTTSARRRPKRAIDYDPAPVPIPLKVPRILGRKPRVRKVTRVVRHVDPWSVFKIAIIAHMVLYLIVLTAGVLLWNVAYATGTVENVERFFESFGWQTFEFNGGEIYHSAWVAGLFAAIGMTGLVVLAATLFNLITDLVGGVRFTVLEEEVVESRTSPMRRFVVRRPEPEIPVVTSDPSGSFIRETIVDDTGDHPR